MYYSKCNLPVKPEVRWTLNTGSLGLQSTVDVSRIGVVRKDSWCKLFVMCTQKTLPVLNAKCYLEPKKVVECHFLCFV